MHCLLVLSFWFIVVLSVMGIAMSRDWEPAETFTLYSPPPWPKEHTDKEGKVEAFKVDGRWQNPWSGLRPPPPLSFFMTMFTGIGDRSEVPSADKLDKTLPVVKPVWNDTSNSRMTWLGHASVLAEVDGHTILTDPIFSYRASAVQFAGPARYRPAACAIDDLPQLSAVVVSHNHYDHLDLNSVRDIAARQPDCEFFVPMGMQQWMVDNTVASKDRVHEMTWWEERKLHNSEVKIVFTPANHWCKRSASDDNRVLWGSWAVIGPTNSFWFGGDTAYCEAFKQIGDKYGPFTMAAIPIGNYQPNWFMKYQHVHPGEAVEIHKDIRSLKSLGIHWGTFRLTFENYLEPPRLLSEYLEKNNITAEEFVSVNIGESVQP